MRKVVAIICTLSIIVSLAACGNQSKKTESSSSSSSTGTSSVSSTSSTSSAKGTSSAADTQSKKEDGSASKSTSSKVTLDYRHKIEKYLYQQNNKDYTANYPQLSPEAPNFQKANDVLKNTGMQTILSLGLQKTNETVKVEVRSTLTYYNNDFISATYEETSNVSTAAHPGAEFRTVNFDLKNGKTVTATDLIVKSDTLNAALLKAAKKQLSGELETAATAAVIKTGMESCSIYVTKGKVGFSLEVPHALGDHIELELTYNDIKPFITKNAIWNTIITE